MKSLRATAVVAILLFIAASATVAMPKNARTAGNVKKEQQATRREINETKAKIRDNAARTRRKLDELNNLSARIDRHIVDIDTLHTYVTRLDSDISIVSARVAALDDSVARFRTDLKNTLRAQRTRRRMHNNVAFVFSASNFNQAYKRMGYLSQLNQWRTGKINRLRGALQRLEAKRQQLEHLHNDKSAALARLNAGRIMLENKRTEEKTMISDLRREGTSLNALLRQKQKKARELDAELDRIIVAEQKRIAAEEKRRAEEKRKAEEKRQAANGRKKDSPAAGQARKNSAASGSAAAMSGEAEASRALSGTFEANRGRLLFPVAGKYTIVSVFGRSHHHSLSNIEVNNSGIDIAVAPGTQARASFAGTVSSVFFMAGFQNIVIIRHGSYLTVYAGLTGLRVKKGQTVKAGTVLGTVYTDMEGGEERTVLHFEVRHEREKLNPLEWVR